MQKQDNCTPPKLGYGVDEMFRLNMIKINIFVCTHISLYMYNTQTRAYI